MSEFTKELITTNGLPMAQYFNRKTDQFEVIEGREGANAFIEKGRVVQDYFVGAATVTKTYETPMFGFGIVNDGTEEITFTINGMNIPVKPLEFFDDLFEPFTTVTVSANTAFRAVVRN